MLDTRIDTVLAIRMTNPIPSTNYRNTQVEELHVVQMTDNGLNYEIKDEA